MAPRGMNRRKDLLDAISDPRRANALQSATDLEGGFADLTAASHQPVPTAPPLAGRLAEPRISASAITFADVIALRHTSSVPTERKRPVNACTLRRERSA